jgi:hypothetical protein
MDISLGLAATCQLSFVTLAAQGAKCTAWTAHAGHTTAPETHASDQTTMTQLTHLRRLPGEVLLRLRGLHHDGLAHERLPAQRHRLHHRFLQNTKQEGVLATLGFAQISTLHSHHRPALSELLKPMQKLTCIVGRTKLLVVCAQMLVFS